MVSETRLTDNHWQLPASHWQRLAAASDLPVAAPASQLKIEPPLYSGIG